ncbi:DUF1385 domain-containing protein [Frisingicoccus sp.]|uniref:DUF1385 domain-containing protein n=1 Tax=Frisingicoccus sp. TaxID=1918627 RepID=UPI002ECEAC5B|nr:DUF1385 domain-containing protein [Frisingicoccus sp.]
MKYANVGGQAVMEGVMMRHKDHYAVSVRKENGEIETTVEKRISLSEKYHVSGIPIIRGMFSFVDSLVLGMKSLMWSASFFEEEETKKTEKDGASDKLFMTLTVILSIALSVGLFMVLPFFVSNIFRKVTDSSLTLGIIEGIVRVLIFIAYIVLISRMKDIQRVFMYHGAEHKTINCIEHGEELTPENAAKYSRFHKRCGTSFLFIVMFVSILFFLLFFQIFPIKNMAFKVICRILMVPIIAGVSYEIIQWAGRHDSGLVCFVSKPGFWMQKFTTREPDRDMLEVAIASIEAIYDWREFQKELEK